jgi:hypothetical protein
VSVCRPSAAGSGRIATPSPRARNRRERVPREREDRGPGLGRRDRDAILALYEQMLADKPHFGYEEPLTTLVAGDIALTATEAQDEAGVRAQIVRRQGDGSWLRVLDRPDFTK